MRSPQHSNEGRHSADTPHPCGQVGGDAIGEQLPRKPAVEVGPASASVEIGIQNRRNGDSQEVTAARKYHILGLQTLREEEHHRSDIGHIENIEYQYRSHGTLHTPGKVEMAGKEETPGKAEAAEKAEVEVPGEVEPAE